MIANGGLTMATSPLFETKQEEAIVTFICENESQWNRDRWDSFRRQVACCNFGIEYGKSIINDSDMLNRLNTLYMRDTNR